MKRRKPPRVESFRSGTLPQNPPHPQSSQEVGTAPPPGGIHKLDVRSWPVERAALRVREEEDLRLGSHHLMCLDPVAACDRKDGDESWIARDSDLSFPGAVHDGREAHRDLHRLVPLGRSPGQPPHHRLGVERDGAHGCLHGLQSASFKLLQPPRDQPQPRAHSSSESESPAVHPLLARRAYATIAQPRQPYAMCLLAYGNAPAFL